MALVMLPCDLPWWPAVVKQLDKAALARNSQDLIGAMQRIHDMCNISLDPDEDEQDPDLFVGLAKFIDEDLGPGEREQMFVKTIPKIVERAKALRNTKPPQGLYFSLQQQGDHVEYSYGFASSLVANAFFSTYPKRTVKTHPTLGDFNFTNFFKYLHLNSQKIKLQSILQYFEFLETDGALEGRMLVSRQVMTSKQWLTIEDWLESNVLLCPLTIRHVGRLERVDTDTKVLHVCFASSRFGEGVLEDAISQETVHIATHPEMLAVILSVEALEDNEVLIVEGARHVSRINNPKQKATFESIPNPNPVTVCCMDAENYSDMPRNQFEEDNILREMNKSLLGFRQRHLPASPTETVSLDDAACPDGCPVTRRLSPIGESFSSASPEVETSEDKVVIHNNNNNNNIRANGNLSEDISIENPLTDVRLRPNGRSTTQRSLSPDKLITGYNKSLCSNASTRSRFIVLGSSGEVLPVTRKSLGQMSVYESCNSQSTESFHSARDSIEDEHPAGKYDEEEFKLTRKYSNQLDTPERRGTFAQRLKEALNRESTATGSSEESSGESSYAVGISISGSHVGDQDIKVRRGGSRGFVLRDETVDEDFLKASLEAEQKWLGKFKHTQQPVLQRKDTNNSSKYSFSTEYSSDFCSELEEVYEQLSKWLDDPIASDENHELEARDRAVIQFAGSLLRRALSESFAGVPVQEGEPQLLIGTNDVQQKHKLALAVRSLSLELARQRNKRQQSIQISDTEDQQEVEEEDFMDAFEVQESPKKVESKRNKWTINLTSLKELETLLEEESPTFSWPLQFPEINIKNIYSDVEGINNSIPGDSNPQDGGLLPVATGNWGCGSRLKGDPQLKLVIQWLAASLAGVPRLIYYTCGNLNLSKLDTVSRVLTDRRWTVGDLSTAMLRFADQALGDRVKGRNSLFDELIGVDKPSP
ncbi:uncharacterized protein LOC123262133 isoform X3 [Cotesia glomerata]|uniref:uncharacterized protein LOC123262133 isoform X3 n=1 Tax=Cotesia glomerata TaxID=32391 RepID=UPI001D01CB2A|nr:uncharacterized protein LOC123262133 isoform X3 [Cotesia glomerata]